MANVMQLTAKNGFKVPALGLGTWKSQKGEVRRAVESAIDAGYRYIDCAFMYRNEDEIGEALEAKIADKTVKREELFVTSKLWNTFHRPDLVKKAFQESLRNLRLDYLDLYLIHWPMAYQEDGDLMPKDENGKFIFSDVDYLDTWKAMESLVDEGLCKAIGVSNFNEEQLDRLLQNCKVFPVNNQVESSPYFTNQKLIDFCQSRGITVTAYSPLGSPDRPWAKPDDPKLLDEPVLKELAQKYKKSTAQIVIRYQLDRGIGVIPKSANEARIKENLDVLDFSLEKEEVKKIDEFNKNYRAVPLDWVKNHKYFPFKDIQ